MGGATASPKTRGIPHAPPPDIKQHQKNSLDLSEKPVPPSIPVQQPVLPTTGKNCQDCRKPICQHAPEKLTPLSQKTDALLLTETRSLATATNQVSICPRNVVLRLYPPLARRCKLQRPPDSLPAVTTSLGPPTRKQGDVREADPWPTDRRNLLNVENY